MKLMDPHFPFSPRKLKFNYCYMILPVAILGMMASIPGQTIGVSVFTDPLIEVSHLSRVELAICYFLGTFISSLYLKKIGPIYDRVGGRKLIVGAGLSLVLVLFHFGYLGQELTYINNIDRFHAFPIVMLILTVSFFLLRFLGQGVIMLTSRNLLGKWFYKKRGLMSAISGLSIAVGFSNVPPMLNNIISVQGWERAYMLIASALLIATFVLWIFYRDNPEECGLFIDGEKISDHSNESDLKKDVILTTHVELQDAIKTKTFWIITSGLSLHALAITAISFHIIDLSKMANLAPDVAVNIFFPMAIVAGIVDLLSGWAADKYPLKWILILMMMGACLGYTSANFLSHDGYYTLTILGLGVTTGCFGTLSNVAMPHYFGTKFLNQISSYFLSYLVFATSLGPIMFALSKFIWNSYAPSLYLCSLFAIIIGFYSFSIVTIRKTT